MTNEKKNEPTVRGVHGDMVKKRHKNLPHAHPYLVIDCKLCIKALTEIIF